MLQLDRDNIKRKFGIVQYRNNSKELVTQQPNTRVDTTLYPDSTNMQNEEILSLTPSTTLTLWG